MRAVHRMSVAQIAAERLKMRVWRRAHQGAARVWRNALAPRDRLDQAPRPRGVYSGSLLDIGANIVLISFQCAHDFS